jgi:excisionase family DNA binding protein
MYSEVKKMMEIQRQMYSVKEIAIMLGLSERTIFRLMKAGKIQAVRIGGQWRIPRSEVEKYIKVEVKNG